MRAGVVGLGAGSRARDRNLWAALAYARETPDPALAISLGASLGMYFCFAERVSGGRQYLEYALAASSDDAPVDLRIELLGWLCFFGLEELDLDAAIEAGESALALSEDTSAPGESALARVMLAVALGQTGDDQRAAKLVEEARQASADGDDGTAAIVRVAGALTAVRAGDVSRAAVLSADAVQHAEAIDYLFSVQAAMLVDAWVAEQRDDEKAAVDAYMRVLELAKQPRYANNAAFALARLGCHAVANGSLLKLTNCSGGRSRRRTRQGHPG
jgi:hypothetical protein